MYYLAVKEAHIVFVTLSILGFLLRSWWMWRHTEMLKHRLTRTLPHINDTLLLGAGIWLAWFLKIYPWESAWLSAKLIALLVYIVLGSIALKRGRTLKIRLTAFLASLAVFAYIVAVALSRSPLPFVS